MATPVVGNIHIGQGEVWLGGSAPASGSDPTDPTAGTPSALNTMTTAFAAPTSGGTYVGFTFGPATLTYRPTYYMVVTEQAFSEVVTIPTNEEASLAFTALEQTYTTIAAAWGQGTTRTTGGAQAVYVGSKHVISTKVVTMMSRKRSGTGYYIVTIYSAYTSDGATVSFERRAESRLPVTMRALADVSRPEGDQLFQLVAYDANPV